jgi:hypothetical protein
MNNGNLLQILETRFSTNMHRHPGIKWEDVQVKLEANPDKLNSLQQMEDTGGEPDVVVFDRDYDGYLYVDCSKETPKGRRSICYDEEALKKRNKKGVHPEGSALGLASKMGIDILSEVQYHELQMIEEFDEKTSSWIKTPNEIRKLGGAIFADRRYDFVFVYHNGADSFYSARSFRGCLLV